MVSVCVCVCDVWYLYNVCVCGVCNVMCGLCVVCVCVFVSHLTNWSEEKILYFHIPNDNIRLHLNLIVHFRNGISY